MKNILEKIKKKSMKQTFLTIVLFAIIIAIYFEINILVEKLKISDIDMTESKLYSITDLSKNKIKEIDKKVQIQLINFEEYSYVSNISNSINIIKKYSEINNNISIEQAENTEYTTPTIILKCDDKTKVLSIDDLYTYEFSSETYITENFDRTEETITNAIMEVTSSNKKNIYLYIAHSSYKDYPETYFSTFINNINGKLNEANYIDIQTAGNIPEDCDCLIIPTLKEDISEIERDLLINYINNGGNILLLQESYGILNLEAPNFQSVIDLYGFSFSNGILMEQSTENMLNNIPEFISVKINSSSKIGETMQKNSKMILIDSGKIDFKDDETLQSLNVSYEVIAQTSESTFLRNNLILTEYSKIDSDEDAPNAIVSALITKKLDENKSSQLIVFSNSILATDSTIPIKDILTNQSKSGKAIYCDSNNEILEQSVKYLSKNTDSIILRKKYYDNIPTMKLIKDSTTIQILYGVPMLIILIGYIVWRIRRNKK